MIAIDDAIRDTRTRLLLQIHDELIYECPQSDARDVLALIKDKMEKIATLKVPLPVSLKMGKSWASLDPVKLDDPTKFDPSSPPAIALPVNETPSLGIDADGLIDIDDDIFSDI